SCARATAEIWRRLHIARLSGVPLSPFAWLTWMPRNQTCFALRIQQWVNANPQYAASLKARIPARKSHHFHFGTAWNGIVRTGGPWVARSCLISRVIEGAMSTVGLHDQFPR